jgi:hypothetical protein
MPTGDVAPSGRHVVVKAAQVFDVEGEKIRDAHHYFDRMGPASADRRRRLLTAGPTCPGRRRGARG